MWKKFLAGVAIAGAFLFTPYGRETVSYAQQQGCIIINGSNRCTSIQLVSPAITVASGTGITLVNPGEVREIVYKVTIDKSAFGCAAVTCDLTIATLPAKTFVKHIIVDLNSLFSCTAVCTSSTLSVTLGKTTGGNEYLISFDADASLTQFGDSAGELGASLTEATVPTANGDLASWTSATAVSLRLTSGTGNIGSGGVGTNLAAGSMTFYITTIKLP